MTEELLWNGTEDVEVFHDSQRNIEYHVSERPHDVPDDAVEWYLSFEGWEPPDETGMDAADDFDVSNFLDRSWQTVCAEIRDGIVDGQLDAVEAAERSHEGGPREDSVIDAIEKRRDELADTTE